jgi:hypothetical protein
MRKAFCRSVFEALKQQGVALAPGLSDAEMTDIERLHSFSFPADLRMFLQMALPVSDGFPVWRDPSSDIAQQLAWPLSGMLFDVDNNGFWLPQWGPKPEDKAQAHAIVRQAVFEAPVLIPIYRHRFIPAFPAEPGNPVLSVYQTDIIEYGADLSSYFVKEFQVSTRHEPKTPAPCHIPFWSSFLS